jgi:hypothetical protein
VKHGFYASPQGAREGPDAEGGCTFYADDPAQVTIDEAIAGLVDKMSRLDRVITGYEGPVSDLTRLMTLYTQASSRLGRLLRERRDASPAYDDEFMAIVAEALEEMGF